MISVTVSRKEGAYTGIRASGHAYYADPGQDIICAAVSVLMINTVNSIEVLCKDTVADETMEDGFVSCTFPKGLSREGSLFVESLILGIRQIAETYETKSGKPYVQLIIEEV
jgi:uncharacterized protein YsxB (DUF464 family)